MNKPTEKIGLVKKAKLMTFDGIEVMECPYCRDSEDFPVELDDGICNICGHGVD